jgi:hypothetical protein
VRRFGGHYLTATAGGFQTICSNVFFTVSGASSTNGTISWTENGAGTITAGGTTLTPTYTAADAGNTVTLTMTVTSSNACASQTVTATYSVTITKLPVFHFLILDLPYCSNGSNPAVTLNAEDSNWNIWFYRWIGFANASTGEINIAASTGIYTVTNTIAAANGCSIVTSAAGITHCQTYCYF